MDWFDPWLCPPPRDGSWLFVVFHDFSGADILTWHNGEWIDASGEGGLMEPENFRLHHALWAYAPKWMRMHCDRQDRDKAFEKWKEGILPDRS